MCLCQISAANDKPATPVGITPVCNFTHPTYRLHSKCALTLELEFIYRHSQNKKCIFSPGKSAVHVNAIMLTLLHLTRFTGAQTKVDTVDV